MKEVRVDAEIGSDPAELDGIADAVVRGCSIRYARITSLRGLIEAVQRHPQATLAPPAEERGQGDKEDWKPPKRDSPDALTELAIYGGEVADDGDSFGLDIRVTLTLPTGFNGDAGFEGARFGGNAFFHAASFGGDAGFDDAYFGGNADFHGASFGGDARFHEAYFGRGADFSRASFGGRADFMEAIFAAPSDIWSGGGTLAAEKIYFVVCGDFSRAIFTRVADFRWVSFNGSAHFKETRFAGGTYFRGASLEKAILRGAFAPRAQFDDAKLAGEVAHERRTQGWCVRRRLRSGVGLRTPPG